MKWEDEGLILSLKRFGERSLITTFFTREHGRSAGLLKPSKSQKASLQPGSFFKVIWTARLEEHLGLWSVDPLAHGSSGVLLQNPLALAGMTSALSLLEVFMPEREPHSALYEALEALMMAFKQTHWLKAYFSFEAALLTAAGFQLHLERCTATGATQDLAYVSPRSGKAVCQEAGAPYHDKMLTFPAFLKKDTPVTHKDLLDGLYLTEYFFERYIAQENGIGLPLARQRFKQMLQKEVHE